MKIKRWSKLTKAMRRKGTNVPVGTIVYYGPTASFASKAVASVNYGELSDRPTVMMKWFDPVNDLRFQPAITEEIKEFLRKNGALRTVMAERIWGCPHEEGIDYPEGGVCPECPYWANRTRDTGKIIKVQ